MNKTTKIIIAGAAAAIGMLIAGYIWVNNDRQAAVDTFNAFSGAMMEMDIPKAQSMARGEAHAALGMLAQVLESGDLSLVKIKPLGNRFVFADGELRFTNEWDDESTVLRKTDGEWYVEKIFAAISISNNEQGRSVTGDLYITPASLESILKSLGQ